MTEWAIRRAAPSDEALLARLWGSLIAELRALDPRQPEPIPGAAAIYAGRLVRVLKDADTRVLVAEASGTLIGFCLGALVDLQSDLFVPQTSGLIVDLFVVESARRQGVGRALALALLDWFRSRGAVYAELNVASANVAGHAFWESVNGRDYQTRMRIQLMK